MGEAWASEKAQSALPLKAPPDRREDGKVSQEGVCSVFFLPLSFPLLPRAPDEDGQRSPPLGLSANC